jgi:nuclease S1
MKKLAIPVILILFAVVILSWGYVGHQTIARIAENHLTPEAKAAVKQLLGDQSLTDIASWADEVRNQPEWKYTSSWHYVNEPAGLSAAQFKNAVEQSGNDNLLTALNKCELELSSPESTQEQKANDLKFIVHLIGDAHQPMHVSRAEDKGGNTIQVQFDGRGTNLHSVWDTKLIDHQGLSYAQIAKADDIATPAQIKKWQGTGPVEWMYESYQISTTLYSEVEKNNKLDEDYYKQHIGIVNERIEQAGIRLAGVLNQLFKNGLQKSKAGTIPAPPAVNNQGQQTATSIDSKDAAKHYGENVVISDKVYGYKDLGSMVLVNIGGEYPDQLLTIVLRGDAKSMAQSINGKVIKVTGKLVEYKDKPEIVVTDASQIVTISN